MIEIRIFEDMPTGAVHVANVTAPAMPCRGDFVDLGDKRLKIEQVEWFSYSPVLGEIVLTPVVTGRT